MRKLYSILLSGILSSRYQSFIFSLAFLCQSGLILAHKNPSAAGVSSTLNIVSVTPAVVCQGASINLVINSSGFAAGTVFTLQLSDIFGNFTSTTTLATNTNAIFGGVVISTSIPHSAFYAIRIRASDGTISNSLPLEVLKSPKVTITPSPKASICSGTAIVLQAEPRINATYQWTSGANATSQTNIPGQTFDTLLVPVAGFYKVIVDSNSCSVTSAAVQVSAFSNPVANIGITTANFPICKDNNGNGATILRATKNPALQYQWFLNGSPILVNGDKDSLFAAFSGDYFVRVTDPVSGCFSVSSIKTGFTTPNPNVPSGFAGLDSIKCSGDTVVIGFQTPGNNGISYQWTPTAGVLDFFSLQPNAQSPFCRLQLRTLRTIPDDTIYTLIATDVATGCKVQDQVKITINPSPTMVTAVPASASVCVNAANPVQLNGTPLNTPVLAPPNVVGTGVWTGPPGSISQNAGTWRFSANNNDNLIGVQTLTYTYTLNSQNGGPQCPMEQKTSITVLPKPTPNAGKDTSYCTGLDSVILGGNTPAITIANGGFWAEVNGQVLSNNIVTRKGRIVPATMAPGTYLFRYTVTIGGCTNFDDRLITIRLADTVRADTGSFQICNNAAPRKLKGFPTGGAWRSTPPGLIDSAGNLIPNQLNPGLQNKLTYRLKRNGCVSEDSLFVFVITSPKAILAEKFDTLCSKDSTVLLVGGMPEGGKWKGPGVDTLNARFIPGNVNPGRVHEIFYIVEESGCTDTASRFMYVKRSPTAIPGPSERTCINTPRFRVNGFSPSTGGKWYGNGVDTSGFFTPSQALVGNNRLKFLLIDPLGCQDSVFKVVTVNPLPITNAGIDTATCTEIGIRIGSATLPKLEYRWNEPLPGTLSSTFVSNPLLNIVNNTAKPDTFVYALRVRDSISNCSNQDSIRIIVYPKPIAEVFFPNIKAKCTRDSITLRAKSRNGLVYEWVRNGRSLNVPSQSDSIYHAKLSGTYKLVVRNLGAACSDTSTGDFLTFFPRTKPDILGPRYLCEDSTTKFKVTPADTNFNFQWKFGKQLPTQIVADSIKTTFTIDKIGFVRVLITTKNGCVDSSNAIQIDSILKPYLFDLKDTSICEDGWAKWKVPSGFQYRWLDSSGSIYSRKDTLGTNKAGTYYVEVSNVCGSITDSVSLLRVNPLPVFRILSQVSQDTTICKNVPIKLRGPNGYKSYFWESDTLELANTKNQFTDLPDFMADTLTDTVRLTVVDANGCVGKAAARVRIVDCDPILYIPTAFSPQADGTNDLWRIRAYNIDKDKIKVFVYNRWGEMIYYGDKFDNEVRELLNPWNGTYNGKLCQSGAYQYIIEYEGFYSGKAKKRTISGTVTILR